MNECIFHVALADDWEGDQRFGEYEGSTRAKTLDQVGFVHAATAGDLENVLATVYGDPRLPLVVVLSIRMLSLQRGSRSGGTSATHHLLVQTRGFPGSWEQYRWIRTSSSMFSRSRKSAGNGLFPTCPHIRSEIRRGSQKIM